MGKFKNKTKRHKRVPIMYQASVQTLIRGVLQQPFDVSMATLIVLVDVDPTIGQMKDVQDFMSGLTEMEQQFAAMLEAALQSNKVQKARDLEALEEYNRESGRKLRYGEAAADEQFAAWLPGYSEKLKAKWREEHPEEAAAYDAQVAALADPDNKVVVCDAVLPMDQGVAVLQATDAQGDVTEAVPAGVTPIGWDQVETSVPDADMPAPIPADQADTNDS